MLGRLGETEPASSQGALQAFRERLVDEVLGAGGQVICKPWVARNGKSFAAGETERTEFGSVGEFDPKAA